jgi:hypothetical protein
MARRARRADAGRHGHTKPLAVESPLSRIIRRNRAPSVGAYFREVARAAVTASLVMGAAGCAQTRDAHHDAGEPLDATLDAAPAADATPPGFDAAGPPFTPVACHNHSPLVLQGLGLPAGLDYVGAYEHRPFALPTWVRIDALGTPCATAADAEACAQAMDDRDDLWSHHLVTTAGDEVTFLVEPEAVRAFVGPVDSPEKAILLAWHAGYELGCDNPDEYGVREADGGYELLVNLFNDCPFEWHRVLLFVAHDGTVVERGRELIERQDVCVGRRPPGLRGDAAARPEEGTLGYHFARMARLEAAAVTAFEVLAAELESLGAPAVLVEGARAAAQDEVRHAEATGHLARRFGEAPLAAHIEPRPLRSLAELALDNATEGCVRETFGALVGTYQAGAATDDEVAHAMSVIAEDEARHAELSWAVAAWAEPLLAAQDRANVQAARQAAVHALYAEVAAPPDPAWAATAGLPSPATSRALLEHLTRDLWS